MDKEKERLQKKYNDYVKQVTPTHNLWWNMAKAFVTGGIICCIGQFILNVCENYGLDQKTSGICIFTGGGAAENGIQFV